MFQTSGTAKATASGKRHLAEPRGCKQPPDMTAKDKKKTAFTMSGQGPTYIRRREMAKRTGKVGHRVLPPTTCLMPLPAAMVTCRGRDGKDNIITLAWVGVVCSEPPMLSISVRPSRLSRELLRENGDFVVHVPSAAQMEAADHCGAVSGREEDKFAALGLTALAASQVKAAIIAECPVAMECRTRHVLSLGTHDLFVAEILAVQVREDVLDESGRIDLERMAPLGYCPNVRGAGDYVSITQGVGRHGCSAKRGKK
jgi:flavin reductase (DIM6/NTAB) family NADH-FMN oxidoreductase RutF